MNSERWKLHSYVLEDTENSYEYRTGVTLADCTIPFEDLLNKSDGESKYYRNKTRELRKQLKESEKELEKFDKLKEFLRTEFDLDYDMLIEEEII